METKSRREMEENVEDSTDWISQFPECINHHIMSFLDSPKERVRMSVLSKSWFSLTASFPILDFDIHEFPRPLDPSDDPLNYFLDNSTRNNFFKYVEYTTSRFCQQNVTTAHTFKLSTDQLEIPAEVEIAQRCLELILVKGVQVLAMNVRSAYRSSSKPSLWFRKLKQFLEQKNGFKVLNLHLSSRNFLDVEELKVIRSPPNELEHIELKLTDICGLSVYEAVVDAVLWCCCPRSLKLTSRFQTINSTERNQVVMFTYEKLLQQEDEGKINIQIVLSSSKAEKHFSDINSLLTALPCVEQEHVITFIKEEDIQEEVG